MTENQMRGRLEQAIIDAGSLRKWARQAGVNPSMVSLARRKITPVAPVILRALGLERVVTYRKVVEE